ncbi:MAG: hypothetical protein IVW54_11305 [Candidatus Binataceae bacterium]|nr:hypothetical protein [Candidatus Binataceae bacterium]
MQHAQTNHHGNDATLSTDPIAIEELHRELLKPRVEQLAQAMQEPNSRSAYLELAVAIDSLSVPLGLQERLASVIELALGGGRIRREAGPAAEAALIALFKRTARGVELAAGLGSLNRAMAQLAGNEIESVTTALRAPGVYLMTLRTTAVQLVIRFDRNGPEVESLEVGLG